MDKKNKYTISKTIALGKEALTLCKGRERDLLLRLPESMLLTLPQDIETLEALHTGRAAKVIGIKGLTGKEAEVSIKGAKWVTAIRLAIKKRAHNTGLERAVGVGGRFHYYRSYTVLTAIEAILNAYEKYPSLFHNCGVVEQDIENGKTHYKEILDARREQELEIKNKKNLTTYKNQIQQKVENAISSISSAGYLQYLESEPLIAQRFRALTAYSKRTNSRTTEETREEFFSFTISTDQPEDPVNTLTTSETKESEVNNTEEIPVQ